MQVFALILLMLGGVAAHGDEEPASSPPEDKPALTVLLSHPDRQLEAVLALFHELPAQHPADLLASYRRATRDPNVLNKAAQALIAALNPNMVPELRNFHLATFRLYVEPDGSLAWLADIPSDDGSLAAIGTALALTDGQTLPGDPPIDQLGPRDGPFMAVLGSRAVISSSATRLRTALITPPSPLKLPDHADSALLFQIEPEHLTSAAAAWARTLGRAAQALRLAHVNGRLALDADQIALKLQSALQAPAPEDNPAVDLRWLDHALPNAACTLSLAIDSNGHAIATLFALLDALLVDPDLTPKPAPLRTRFNLAANLQGVRPELELWPKLVGCTLSLRLKRSDVGAPEIEALRLSLHASEPDSARDFEQRLMPRLATVPAALGWLRPDPQNPAAPSRLSWKAVGQTLNLDYRTPDAPVPNEPEEHDPARLQGVDLAALSSPLLALFWPSQWPFGQSPGEQAFARALRDAPPVIWRVEFARGQRTDSITWNNLRSAVARLVDALPRAAPLRTEPLP